jgi:glycosyltransferase involved in cell wall biosynthesis
LRPLIDCHDFAVVTQENKMLNNVPLLLGAQRCRIALWGHGRNFQAADAKTAGMAQSIKAALSRRADWWFAYTEMSAELVRDFGYPNERITVLNNSIDTASLGASIAQARLAGKAALRARYGLPPDGPLGLYIGSLYSEKRLDLLVEGAKHIRAEQPAFHLAIVGAGPELDSLKARTADLPWVKLLGPRAGREKAELLAAADVILNPGLVGLGILDGFTAGLPMVTTDCGVHSPEISYLQHGINGLMTQPESKSFARAVIDILSDETLAATLKAGADQSAEDYNMSAMVARFCDGVQRWRASARLGKASAER